MVKPPLRTKSIGFKVSEEEYAQLETAAQASGRTLGEWCRELILLAVWPILCVFCKGWVYDAPPNFFFESVTDDLAFHSRASYYLQYARR